ncbi:MAG: hypothetical protein AAB758_00155 [Patescibacteria group bacterium]|mgnify:CR=1 FL=1
MRRGIALSVFLSIILIVGALWSRYSHSALSITENGLTVVSAVKNDSKDLLDTFIKTDEEVVAAPETLNNSDILGRGLLSEYINLTTNKRDSDQNVDALVNKYIQTIPTLVQSEVVNYFDLKIVANNKANFNEYAQGFAQVESGLAQMVTADNSPLNFSKAYSEAAKTLKKMDVPVALASVHLQLLNSYLLSAEAMGALSKMDSDPTTAFSGLVVVNSNLDKENNLINEIAKILKTNGV